MENSENENKVCKFVKSLYRLKQTPKQWHEKFKSVLRAYESRSNNDDKCIYSKFIGKYEVIIYLYIDNMLIVGINYQAVVDTKKYFSAKFKIKDFLDVDTILGSKVKRPSGGF